jgi:hypothetical protein
MSEIRIAKRKRTQLWRVVEPYRIGIRLFLRTRTRCRWLLGKTVAPHFGHVLEWGSSALPQAGQMAKVSKPSRELPLILPDLSLADRNAFDTAWLG